MDHIINQLSKLNGKRWLHGLSFYSAIGLFCLSLPTEVTTQSNKKVKIVSTLICGWTSAFVLKSTVQKECCHLILWELFLTSYYKIQGQSWNQSAARDTLVLLNCMFCIQLTSVHSFYFILFFFYVLNFFLFIIF